MPTTPTPTPAVHSHSITRGAWYAHVSWLFRRREASADVTRLNDLWPVRSIRLQHRWYPLLAITTGLVVPALLGLIWHDPIGGLLVVGFLRAAVLLQATFCIDSLAHLLGRRTFDEGASARNSTVTALVTFGEGYHSYHHRFPFDFRNGVRWWHYDPSKWLIVCLERVRLTSRLRRAAPASIDAAARYGGREPAIATRRTICRSFNMTVSKRAAAKRPATDWKSPGSPHELGTAEQLAHASSPNVPTCSLR